MENYRFNIGDKVKVRDFKKIYSSYDTMFEELKFKNTRDNPRNGFTTEDVFTVFSMAIHHTNGKKLVAIERFGKQLLISEDALEITADSMEFTKRDLVTGYVVETRNGSRGLVMLGTSDGDVIVGDGSMGESTWGPLERYSEDLLTKQDNSKEGVNDIVKVYGYDCNKYGASLHRVGPLLWERKVVKEVTRKQLEVLVGGKFKIVD